MSTQDVDLYRGSGVELTISREPKLVLEEARKAALVLQDVIAHKKKPVVFNDEQYIEFEDWQTVGKFYNLSARVRETRFVQFGEVMGWEATADIINVMTGAVVSSADAMCLNDEEKWSTKNKYEWHYVLKSGGTQKEDPGSGEIEWIDNPNKPGKKLPKKERVLIGQERVPQFQLRSMAQTRACAKAFGNILRWVVVLAGYKTTPAEEMPEYSQDGDYHDQTKPKAPPIQQPQRKSEAQSTNGDRIISKEQVSRLWAKAYALNLKDKAAERKLVDDILATYGYQHADKVKLTDYDAIIAWIEKGQVPSSDPEPSA